MNHWNSTIKVKPCKKCGKYHNLSFVCKPKHQKREIRHKIKPVSKKQSKMVSEYRRRRESYLERFKTCQIKTRSCTGKATEIHHAKGRGKYLNDESTWFATCRGCHAWIEDTGEGRKWAKENGFVKTRV